jgi:hypothetical protein
MMMHRVSQYSLGTYLIEEWYTPEKTKDGSDPEPFWKTISYSGGIVSTLKRLGRGDLIQTVESCYDRVETAILNAGKYEENQFGYRIVVDYSPITCQLEKYIKESEKTPARWMGMKWVNKKFLSHRILESLIPPDSMKINDLIGLYKLGAEVICETPHWYRV